jgi:hypothetical protein
MAFDLGIRADVKKLFFDRASVERAVDRAELQQLSKAGAFVRRAARSSIRKRKKPSAPGKPPSSHVGTLREGILFAFERRIRSVVVGPVRINRTDGAPERLEFGGKRSIDDREARLLNRQIRSLNSAGRDIAGRFVKAGAGAIQEVDEGQTLNYMARPFMRPALEREAPKFPKLFANSVHR